MQGTGSRRRAATLLTALTAVAVACGGGTAADLPPAAALAPNGLQPFPGVYTGGQPSADQLDMLAEAGFAGVINLRTEGEEGSEGEAERVAALGMEYVAIPVAGAEGMTEENARALADALARTGRPVLVHCASGNRVGGLFALKSGLLDGSPVEEAMEVGLAAGLTRLEPVVRERLERPRP